MGGRRARVDIDKRTGLSNNNWRGGEIILNDPYVYKVPVRGAPAMLLRGTCHPHA